MKSLKFIAIIPARFASTRFPGKPLAAIAGKPMIQHVYERVSQVFDECYVATDDERIKAAVESFNGKVVMTSPDHKSGTDRCQEAVNKLCTSIRQFDVVVNVQGDEPFIAEEQLRLIKECFNDQSTDIATLVKPFTAEEDIFNPNTPKVVLTKDDFAMYFSRSVIPYQRNATPETWQSLYTYYKHIGLYAYRTNVLEEITSLELGSLEKAESLEQLRWLENGYKIKCAHTCHSSYGIDTPEDMEKIQDKLGELLLL